MNFFDSWPEHKCSHKDSHTPLRDPQEGRQQIVMTLASEIDGYEILPAPHYTFLA